MELRRYTGKEFQDFTAQVKEIVWDLNISSHVRGNLNRLLPLGHNVGLNSALIYFIIRKREREREREKERETERERERETKTETEKYMYD